MAFYEMLPGAGMPPGLQAGMDSVLNKKFGTSTTYPAEGWPDTVNLMGPLPEKTASGAIVTFADGADGVPLKKCEVALPASLDGYSSVNVFAAGTSYGTFTNGYGIGLDGLPQVTATRVATLNPIPIDPDITYKVYSATNQNFIIGVLNNGTLVRRVAYIPSGSIIDTSGGTDLYVCMYNAQNNKVTVEDDKPIVFESTETITTHTAQLGRTIYGGTADVANGTGKPYGHVDLGSLTWTKVTSGQAPYFASSALNPSYRYVNNNPNALVEGYTQASIGGSGTTNGFFITDGSSVRIRDDNYTSGTANEFKEAMSGKYVVYELATAEPFTFDPVPIDSKLGNNTIWSEQGYTEVTYRADINLALGGN